MALRFVFGGLVTVLAGYLGHRFGPLVGGACLAFPAILPASVVLVKEHDGRKKAGDDARGATLGALGLVAFATTVTIGSTRVDASVVLLVGTAAWLVVSVAAFLAVYGWRKE